MKVLIACEESQTVCKAFRAKGHEAYSCDIQECSGGHPEWHYQEDVFEVIEKYGPFDIMIAFPPCTHIANAGGAYFEIKRKDGRQEDALNFLCSLMIVNIPKIAIENPIGILSGNYIKKHFPYLYEKYKSVNMPRKHDQHIEPFYFGDPFKKYTCLWLKNLKPLTYQFHDDLFSIKTSVVPKIEYGTMVRKGVYRTGTIRKLYWADMIPKKDRSKIKSKTFQGIADAMAEQWG